jgi:hypothetical protein
MYTRMYKSCSPSARSGGAAVYQKRSFSVHFGRHPKIPGFTHGIVFKKPSQNQNPKNPTPWMSYGTAAPRPALYFS